MAEPKQIVAGDTAAWGRSEALYPASGGWTLTYYLAKDATNPIAIQATASGDDHAVSVPAATTAGWAPGAYRWTARVNKAGEVVTLQTGHLVILADPSTASDPRSHAEKALAAITAVLEGRLADPLAEYEIDGLKATLIPHADLLRLRAVYADAVRRQKGGAFFRRRPVR